MHRCLASRHNVVSCQHRSLSIGAGTTGRFSLQLSFVFFIFFKKNLGGSIKKTAHLWLFWCFCIWRHLTNLRVLVSVENGLSVNLLWCLVVGAIILTAVVLTAEPLYFSFDLVLNKVGVPRTSQTLDAEVLASTQNSGPWIWWGSKVVNLELNLLLHCLIQPQNTVTFVDWAASFMTVWVYHTATVTDCVEIISINGGR